MAACVVEAQVPVANISATPISGCAPLAVSFNGISTGSPTGWSWTFPGGSPASSTAQNTAVLFTTPGQYDVTLVTTNASGTSQPATVRISIYGPPNADFTQDKTTGCAPTTIHFTDASNAGTTPGASIVSYAWDFGDGYQDATPSPSHRYTAASSYPVTLYVKNNFGCTGKAQVKNVQQAIVLTGIVVPNFSSSLNSSCTLPVTANFTNSSTGPPVLQYLWDFGDGSPTDNTFAPTHQYTAAGTYTVKLAVSNTTQGCSDTLPVDINISASGNISSFSGPDTACVGNAVGFANTSSPFPNSSTWNYGDGSPPDNTRDGLHTFANPGVFTVTVTNSFTGCSGSTSKTVHVVAPPVANFTGVNIKGCKPPLTSTFTDASTNATAWLWSFGDGTPNFSGKTPPPHTYNKYGDFTVTLTASTVAGCSTNQTLTVNIDTPRVKITGLPGYGCTPFVLAMTAASTAVDGIASYAWDFGNGNTSTLQNPPPQNYTAGVYHVKLTATTNGGCLATDTGTVKVGTIKPVPDFTFAPTTSCVKSAIQFSDGSTAGTNQWFWEFGDGNTSIDQDPKYSYLKPGTFNVRLSAYIDGCWDSLSKKITINPPLAAFDFTAACSQKNNFTFIDKSEGPQSWIWDFGDMSPTYSGQTPPLHNFPPGAEKSYNVTLTVSNTATGCNDQVMHAVVANQSTTLSFSANPVCRNTPVHIVSNSPKPIKNYVFDLGDGFTRSSPTPDTYNTFTKPGQYTVKVITTDSTGCVDSAIAVLTVTGPTANFSMPPAVTCNQLSYTFQDLSSIYPAGGSPIVKWSWTFGDGGTSTAQNPPYTYTVQGNFRPSLTVTDNNGCTNTLDTVRTITVSIMAPAFNVKDPNSCPGAPNPLKFNNTSTGGFLPAYTWSFGDGVTSNQFSPNYAYGSVNKFTATLSMKDTYGCTQVSAPVIINVDTPHASFNLSAIYSACPPLNEVFTFTGHYADIYAWVFANGGQSQLANPSTIYTDPGDYGPYLRVTSKGGCVAISEPVNIHIDGPIGTFAYAPVAGCDSLTVNFNVTTTNVVSFIWYSGEGIDSTVTTTPGFQWKYTTPGQFTPIVYLVDAAGCRIPKIGQQSINIDHLTALSFAADRNIVCDTGTIIFTDKSLLGPGTQITNYLWNFGDGSAPVNTTVPTTAYKYLTVGNDSVSMTVTSLGGCTGTTKIPVSVAASPNISIGGLLSQCEPAQITYTGILNVADPSVPLTWSWVFGNGQLSTVQNPAPVDYPKAGEYVVYLKATNSKGCTTMTDSTKPNHLLIYPLPTIFAGLDTTVCIDVAAGFGSATLHATGDATSYTWTTSLPAIISCPNCTDPLVTSPSTASFILSGRSLQSCTTKDTVIVTVNTPVTVNISGPDSVCLGQSSPLNASGASIYEWTPSTGLNNPGIANPIATPTSAQIGNAASNIITYTVTGYDSKKCFSNADSVHITAFNYPVIDMPSSATINVGTSYHIMPSVSTNLVELNWTPSNTLSCNCLTPTATPVKTTTYILSAMNDGGCVMNDTIRVQVICDGANFFVPNSFSPNGDGVNDRFIVNGVGLTVIPSITIYNRWGQIVFQKSNFSPNSAADGWDGLFNGQPAPADVYVYTVQILCNNATLIPYQGNLTLIR